MGEGVHARRLLARGEHAAHVAVPRVPQVRPPARRLCHQWKERAAARGGSPSDGKRKGPRAAPLARGEYAAHVAVPRARCRCARPPGGFAISGKTGQLPEATVLVMGSARAHARRRSHAANAPHMSLCLARCRCARPPGDVAISGKTGQLPEAAVPMMGSARAHARRRSHAIHADRRTRRARRVIARA